MLNDLVRVNDAGRIQMRSKTAALLEKRWGGEDSVVEVKGWVSALLRERGKIVPGSRRQGHNIWTNTGREYLAMLMTLQSNGSSPYRADHVAYMGVGTGSQTEDATVTHLVTPAAVQAGTYLVPIDNGATTFPLTPTRTTVQFEHIYAEGDITYGATSSLTITELGLFTDGEQYAFTQGARDTGMTNSLLQSPIAYKNLLEPLTKTSGLEFQVDWQIRF